MKVGSVPIETLASQLFIPSEKLHVLQDTTLKVLRNRGLLSDEEMEVFYEVGYTQRNLLEIILGLSQKVMSNYMNHIAKTPTDKVFSQFAWQKKQAIEPLLIYQAWDCRKITNGQVKYNYIIQSCLESAFLSTKFRRDTKKYCSF